jgi:hypothetical protein
MKGLKFLGLLFILKGLPAASFPLRKTYTLSILGRLWLSRASSTTLMLRGGVRT